MAKKNGEANESNFAVIWNKLRVNWSTKGKVVSSIAAILIGVAIIAIAIASRAKPTGQPRGADPMPAQSSNQTGISQTGNDNVNIGNAAGSVVIHEPPKSLWLGPKAPTEFVASTNWPGIEARFSGTVVGGLESLDVHLDTVVLSFPSASPDGKDRYITYYRLILAENELSGWKPQYQGDQQVVNQPLKIGGSITLPARSLHLPLHGLNSLAGHFLIFEIGVASSEQGDFPGTTYAFAPAGLL